MFIVFILFWLTFGQSRNSFPILPPPNTTTEVFKIGESLAGNEEYFIQLRGRNDNIVYACINFFYYKSDVYGFGLLPPYFPYCIINYLNVPYFSQTRTIIDTFNLTFSREPNFSLNYLSNYILNFALNFMQSCLNPAPVNCYSYLSFSENLAGQLYQNFNQFYQNYQFFYNNAPQLFSDRQQMILRDFDSFKLYNFSQRRKNLLCLNSLKNCKLDQDSFYSTPTERTNYTQYRCYTDPVYIISVRRKIEKRSVRPSIQLRYPAEASVSYVLQYSSQNLYLTNFFRSSATNYALIIGWGTTTEFQDISTGKFVLEDMIKELRARNEKIQTKIRRIYAILGGANCLNQKIFTDVGFRQISGAIIINPATGKNYCFDAKCTSLDFTQSCLNILNNVEFDRLNSLNRQNSCSINLVSNCSYDIENILIPSLTQYAKNVILNSLFINDGSILNLGLFQVYEYNL
jgi:hypothetical protein